MLQADKYSASPGEGHLAEPITDVQPTRREPLFMPPDRTLPARARKGERRVASSASRLDRRCASRCYPSIGLNFSLY